MTGTTFNKPVDLLGDRLFDRHSQDQNTWTPGLVGSRLSDVLRAKRLKMQGRQMGIRADGAALQIRRISESIALQLLKTKIDSLVYSPAMLRKLCRTAS